MHRLEMIILKNLIHNDDYSRKVLPFIKPDYFFDTHERHVFDGIVSFMEKYKNRPTHEALVISFSESSSLKEEEVKEAVSLLSEINTDKDNPTDPTWLIDQTEKFCQDKAVYLAVRDAISILDGDDKKQSKGAIPEMLQKALAVSFDTNVGHDYLESSDDRFDFYHRKEEKIATDIELLNRITKGGFSRKTLNVILAGTGVGKTLIMCHLAAAALTFGKNVLYITMEMAEERIAERIDANLLNISLDDLIRIPKSEYDRRIGGLRNKTNGKLIIKEYPTASASVLHFRSLLNELHLKKNFVPDIIFIDYLNICISARIKMGSQVNSYTYIKSIAEEIRGLAVECDVPVISATQTTRGGFDNSDPGLTDTSESFGLPHTVDFMMAAINTEELEKLHQLMIKQLKNRYDDIAKNKRFVVGIDKSKMRLYNLEASAQQALMKEEEPPEPKKPQLLQSSATIKRKFKEFKI